MAPPVPSLNSSRSRSRYRFHGDVCLIRFHTYFHRNYRWRCGAQLSGRRTISPYVVPARV